MAMARLPIVLIKEPPTVCDFPTTNHYESAAVDLIDSAIDFVMRQG